MFFIVTKQNASHPGNKIERILQYYESSACTLKNSNDLLS